MNHKAKTRSIIESFTNSPDFGPEWNPIGAVRKVWTEGLHRADIGIPTVESKWMDIVSPHAASSQR
jgi:hypothetical protein